jgi:alkylhydroperoxidase family enzyme
LQGVLSHRDHELLALRAAWCWRSDFEWGEHVEYARRAGLADAEIAAVAEPVADDAWSPHERALLLTVDELRRDGEVSDSTWSVLARHYDASGLVEILYVVGQYTMLSMVANAARLGTPAGSSPLPGVQR